MTKTISLADDAYDALVSVKGEDESFSELARRAARELALRRMFDRTLPPLFTKAEGEQMKRNIRKWRDETMEPRHKWPK